ncbi:MAG: DUF177 domain-containing protein [Armatimonadota bacterium]|nr:DUF177 domain-containing protein [Armatimonadota bacterium]MDR7400693.1 DUF177 domain-containing protein [Armatimonadota bacterium]MDR7403626.1 DUF177 domain-containing protein [Armatimonadota bacterium]MDR7436496.1 DUF177 domain-containing protein [Armatimonadota bacterium]MDR7472531.1 DUF177 domain-containing protein [Armatimonadota bacterium]
MRVNVAELERGQVLRAAFHERVDSRADDVVFDEPVVGEVEVERTSRTVHLRGEVRTTAPMVCGRCLTTFRSELRATVDEEFLIGGTVRTGGELGPEDFQFPLGPDMILDVTDVVRQYLLLALPMVPLCRPDCRGLCPRCGANRNEGTCGCAPEADDVVLPP